MPAEQRDWIGGLLEWLPGPEDPHADYRAAHPGEGHSTSQYGVCGDYLATNCQFGRADDDDSAAR